MENKKTTKILMTLMGLCVFLSLIVLQAAIDIVTNYFRIVFIIMYMLAFVCFIFFKKYYIEEGNYIGEANKTVLKFTIVVSIISFAGLLADIILGKTIGKSFVYIVFVLLATVYVLSMLVFFKNENSKKYKYFILIEFIVMYMIFVSIGTYWMFFSTIAMLVIFTVYGDRKFNFTVGIIINSMTFIGVRLQLNNVTDKENIYYYVWMYLVMFFISFVIVLCTISSSTMINMMAKDKLKKVEHKQLITQSISKEAAMVGNQIKENINKTTLGMKYLDESSADSIKIFDEIIEDNDNNVNGTKIQRNMIRKIINMISNANMRIDIALEMINNTLSSLENSIDSTNIVSTKSQSIIDKNNKVKKQLSEYIRSVENLKGFTNSIEEIVNQEDLLSISAAIESQRSEVDNKEFDLVANEIQTLAEKSDAFVSQIKSTIFNLEKNLAKVNNTIFKVDLSTKQEDVIIKKNIEQLKEMRDQIMHLKLNVTDSLKNLLDVIKYIKYIENVSVSLYEESKKIKDKTIKVVGNNKENIYKLSEIKEQIDIMNRNAKLLVDIEKIK